MTREYKVVRAEYNGGFSKTRLITVDSKDADAHVADFFENASKIVCTVELGRVQIEGATHLLTDSYLED